MGEVAALRQLIGQVQELWDLYGANAHPLLPRQAPHFLPPLPRLRLLPSPRLARICSLPRFAVIVSRELASALVLICRPLLSAVTNNEINSAVQIFWLRRLVSSPSAASASPFPFVFFQFLVANTGCKSLPPFRGPVSCW
jgi:hypothetical protein